jgi:hypothetical protein
MDRVLCKILRFWGVGQTMFFSPTVAVGYCVPSWNCIEVWLFATWTQQLAEVHSFHVV